MYMQLFRSKDIVPLLFTLRWPGAVSELEALIEELQRGHDPGRRRNKRIVLLVDGYDEIDERERQRVSKALILFSSFSLGNFYLTCRSHYYVYDIKCQHAELGPFTADDARKFIDAYFSTLGFEVNADSILAELDNHHLGEFAQHPLMLTLVCILKTVPRREIPRRAIGLLRRAIDTLTFRWDEAKHVTRPSTIPLDGEERVRCLMRIAFEMDSPQASWDVVQKAVETHLQLIQVKGVDARQLVEEMARFYGILVPVGADQWQFAHRTVHDYLSARYWVESGKFDPNHVGKWDIHAAFAACLTPDATNAMSKMLGRETDIAPFIECLYNTAPFDAETIARKVISRLSPLKWDLGRDRLSVTRSGNALKVVTDEDIWGVASNEFLRVMLTQAGNLEDWADRSDLDFDTTRQGAEAVAVCSMAELIFRRVRIRPRHLSLLNQALLDKTDVFDCGIGNRFLTFGTKDLIPRVPGSES
jgi:hypothetical protein